MDYITSALDGEAPPDKTTERRPISTRCPIYTTGGNVYYAITIKPMLKDKVYYLEDFEPLFKMRLRRFELLKHAWENDSSYTLHCHILASGDPTIRYKSIHQYGWHIDIQRLTNQEDKFKWERYLRKRDSVEEQFKHQLHHKNLFEEELPIGGNKVDEQ